ncbi:hypothetical protein [Bradyrhizobium sp. dw_78]|uniref:hypothetical protein n=1 Tax=Bradyrhizobium sp. dw_78 TaxID=2719793 RepID=UPI001BD5B34C|nr:hypothetical protein [Bradyrhizobium sp. dw_78]
MSTGLIANIEQYKTKLFELYTRFRYNELICDELMRRASQIEGLVRWSVLISVLISLVTGALDKLNPPALTPVWAVFGALATFLAIYSLVVGSGGKRFEWFGHAARFHALAEEVEFFSEYVKLGKITESELLDRWQAFSKRLGDLLHQCGVEHRDYARDNAATLKSKIEAVLKDEGKSNGDRDNTAIH